ncbi:MAG TPA: GH3 auxin-responsive promoter family protein [Candidatus Angelobacter sp.]|nr:GH3 auxin-responsive promoter family protein [Candidatus Angelobacter sp.]
MFESLVTRACNRLWFAAQRTARHDFARALRDPEGTQRDLLQQLLESNQNCRYGRMHEFRSIHGVRDFQHAVPIVSYDDLEPWIEKIKGGEPQVLTEAPVLMMEESSGSTAAAKYVPYTQALRREFQNALAAWMGDLFSHYSPLFSGCSYWVVTPLARKRERTEGGLCVGFESDDEYFGVLEQHLIRRLMAVPREVAHVGQTELSLYVTLRFLLQARDLVFISAWNPSFVIILLDKLQEFGDRLVHDMDRGTIDLPSDLPAHVSDRLRRAARPHGLQARALRAMLRSGRIEPSQLWPRLELISCWTSAAAAAGVQEIDERFPGVTVQGKGLLATEGVVSIPLEAYGGSVPAYTSHFLEFLEDGGGVPRLAHELQAGREYSVIITTGGGFWRYRLGDRVRVASSAGPVPLLEFIGKEDGVSDLCGEKLSPAFVNKVFDQLRDKGLLSGRFSMLAPAAVGRHYILFTDGAAVDADLVEQHLRENPQYDYCRRIGQLGPMAIFKVKGRPEQAYIRTCEGRGQRAGSVKPTSLDARSGWEEVFAGEWVSRVEVPA